MALPVPQQKQWNKPSVFLKGVASELRKVSWPKSKELISYTAVVLSTVTFLAIFFAVVDLGISQLIELIIG